MLKKLIKYTDFNGNNREEEFYFNLTKAELTEMQYSNTGSMEQFIKKIINEQDNDKLIQLFKEIILKSYGEKSMDGKRFIKNQELRDSFEQTEAYSELFMELATDSNKAAEFINGIIPQDLRDQTNKPNPIPPSIH